MIRWPRTFTQQHERKRPRPDPSTFPTRLACTPSPTFTALPRQEVVCVQGVWLGLDEEHWPGRGDT
jgi:hypothetical protein